MHAASDRIVKRGAGALVGLLVLAGCTAGGSDNPSLSPSSTSSHTSLGAGVSGPAVSIVGVAGVPVPQLAGQAQANATLRGIGSGLRGSCQVTTLRDDPKVASFQWRCRPGGITTATFSLPGERRLSLADLFKGRYAAYLSTTAATQLEAEGAVNPDTGDLSRWALTPVSLEVVFAAGAVAFPLSSLKPYLRDPALLSP